MAKGNLFQGMGRGKVGDVVFSRLNGQQVSRVRNRNPKNPRTNAQLYQRAIMATVMQAYSAGMAIFDHSFQGKEVGAQNQRRFMSLNAKLLRSQIAADIDGEVAVASQEGRVVAPGVSSPVPALLQVSEGSLVNTLIKDGTLAAAADANETLAEYCSRLGLSASDLFTFVALVIPNGNNILFTLANDDTNYSKQFGTIFVYARYKIKSTAFSATTKANVATFADIFELSDSNFTPATLSTVVGSAVAITDIYAAGSKGASAWIRSRFDQDLRSSETLSFGADKDFGIASTYALPAWKQGTANLGDSDLILEGGNF